MLTNQNRASGFIESSIWLAAFIGMVSVMALPLAPVQSQGSFDSGSTGADGAFNPTISQQLQLPPDGIFNFTTVNIPVDVVITFKRNAKNTPVFILASGNVVINGGIDVRGADAASFLAGGAGGPGGFDGGRGGTNNVNDANGFNGGGPGGGHGGLRLSQNNYRAGGGGGYAIPGFDGFQVGTGGGGSGGISYGISTLIPLIGGSGGGGGAGEPGVCASWAGGGGGGAVLIASSGTISGNYNSSFSWRGAIRADGGASSINSHILGGGGSGGAVRLIANKISGNLSIFVVGGSAIGGFSCATRGGDGGPGYVRIESYDVGSYTPDIRPTNAILSISTPNPVFPPSLPALSITSVAGIASPANPIGSFNGPTDITIPTTQTSPVTVAIAANNIPLGTTVQVNVTPENGAVASVTSTLLAGTLASSTATADVTLPSGVSLITATTTVDLTLMSHVKPIFIDGERVRKMEIAASYGGKSEITYITESGKRIKRPDGQ